MFTYTIQGLYSSTPQGEEDHHSPDIKKNANIVLPKDLAWQNSFHDVPSVFDMKLLTDTWFLGHNCKIMSHHHLQFVSKLDICHL